MLYGLHVSVQKAEKVLANKEVETRKREQRAAAEVHFASVSLQFAAALQDLPLLHVAQRTARAHHVDEFVQRRKPAGQVGGYFAEHRLEHVRNIFQRRLNLVQHGGCADGYVLRQQKIKLVALAGIFGLA